MDDIFAGVASAADIAGQDRLWATGILAAGPLSIVQCSGCNN